MQMFEMEALMQLSACTAFNILKFLAAEILLEKQNFTVKPSTSREVGV